MKNYNVSPYFDDFDEFKNFHQIMFKPGYAVQARELTQLQTVLRNQFEKFGNHVFQHGSIVIPGNSTSNLAVPYVTVENSYSGRSVNTSRIIGKILVGATTGVEAVVQKIEPATATDPLTFYIGYVSGGTTGGIANGNVTFIAGEELFVKTDTAVRVILKTGEFSGVGSISYVNQGVYYVNGTFVSVENSSVVISKYSGSPSCHVLLKINEEIIDHTEEESLLDNSQGSSNYAAPGADRLKIYLTLAVLPIDSAITEDYIEIMRYRKGVLEEHARFPKYNELEKSMARRTYEESGDYIVNGLKTSVIEHKKVGNNRGAFADGSADKYLVAVTPGKAYVQGFGVESLIGSNIEIEKARSADHITQDRTDIKAEIGQYMFISNPKGNLNISAQEEIKLWNISGVSGGTQIGTAYAYAIDYHDGDGSSESIYKLYVRDIKITNAAYGYEDIAGIRLTSGNFTARICSEYFMPITTGTATNTHTISYGAGARIAQVAFYNAVSGMLYAHKHTTAKAPLAGDTVIVNSQTVQIISKSLLSNSGQNGMVIELGRTATKSLKNPSLSYDMSYTAMVVLTMAAGTSTVSLSNGTFVPLEVGTFIAMSSSSVEPVAGFSLSTNTHLTRIAGPAPTTLSIYCQVKIANAAPRIKSKTASTQTGLTASSTIVLNKADVYNIKSVRNGSAELKNQFELDVNVTDYEYGPSKLKLKRGYAVPAGPLTVEYDYFLHSAGDFFTVDSYAGVSNGETPVYVSPSTGKEYQLRDCIDFRKTFDQQSNTVVNQTFISTSIQRFIQRYDLVCMDKTGNISVLKGNPSEDKIRTVTTPDGLIALSEIYVPAYGYTIDDVSVRQLAVDTYTMKNIAEIETRISKLEEFSTLTAVESEIINTPYIDAATGLDRYKTGYFVESMIEPDLNSSSLSYGFKASMTPGYGIYAHVDQTPVNAESHTNNASSISNTNGVVTLKFAQTPLAQVSVASKINNLNPFEVISWTGTLGVFPPGDIWTETKFLPEINRSVTVVETIWLPWIAPPAPAPTPPAPSPGIFVIGPTSPPPVAVFGPQPQQAPVIAPALTGAQVMAILGW